MKALMRRPEHAAITAVRCLTPPPFDNFDSDALARAKKLAAEHGKPKTCDEGLRAIHAVLHVKTAEEAFQHFGVAKQRFSEWKNMLPAASASSMTCCSSRICVVTVV